MSFPASPPGDQRSQRDSAPASSATAMSSGGAVIQQGRAVFIDCTTVGSITFQFADATTLAFTFPATGLYEFNWSITKYTLGSGAATVYNLY